MQIYALRLFNFMRFGEKDNSVVFDISPEDHLLLENGKITIDKIYDKILENPVDYVEKAKARGLTNLIGIAGIMGDDYDLSNGCGKSTILEGICYAHYEQVVRRNVNTDKIATAGLSVVTKINEKYPPKMRESWVEEIFEEGGKIYRIKRGRTFTSTQQNSSPLLEFVCYNEGEEDSQAGHRKADTNESIAQVTSMDYDLFVNSVLFGQSDAGKFLTGSDKTRKEMLVSLLKLEGVISGCLENIRKRKNAKDKEITTLNAQIDIVDGNLKTREGIDVLEGKIEVLNGQIKDSEAVIKDCNDKIQKLSNSDLIKIIDAIKEEGKKAKENLLLLKETKESQAKEWRNLYTECDAKEKSQLVKMESMTTKRKSIDDQIAILESDIKSFDVSIREEELKKVEKAKEVKPKLVDALKKIQEEKEVAVGMIASKNSDCNRLTEEISLLRVQLKNAKGDNFICDKCKSKVSRLHIENEIKVNTDRLDKEKALIDDLTNNQKEIIIKLNKIQSNLDKANEYLIKENKIRGEIKDNDNKKQKLEETKKLQSEDYGKMYNDLQDEYQSIKKQKSEYRAKGEEVAKKYDGDIKAFQTKLDELGNKYLSAKKDAEELENKIKILRDNIVKATQDKSQFDSRIGSCKKDIENTQKETIKLQQLKDKQSQETTLLNRLVMLEDIYGLEGIQTRIVKKYLPLLNNYIREILDVLSNGTMTVEVYINEKSKIDIAVKGGMADNFTMTSGGEKTICRLGVSIGLALLTFTRCASKPELICLDEIFSALDVSHEESVFKLLEKLKSKFSRVLVISHRASINDRIEHKILVEKDNGIFGMSKIKKII